MLISQLTGNFPTPGRVEWIGIRPARKQALIRVAEVQADSASGLSGDHYQGRSGKRQLTLIQKEHIAVVAALTGRQVSAQMLRRNLVISGINLLALKDRPFRIGTAVFQFTGLCHPCSRMETILGPGGYNAMRGHGGITARVLNSGLIKVNDTLTPLPAIPDGDASC